MHTWQPYHKKIQISKDVRLDPMRTFTTGQAILCPNLLHNLDIKITTNPKINNSLHNEGKSVVAKRFIRTLKNKVHKYMTSISKNMYIDNLGKIVKKYNRLYYRTIKMQPDDVKPRTYINFNTENNYEGTNYKDTKFKVGDYVRILQYKNIFAKGYVSNCSEENLSLKKLKILCCGHI